MGKESGDPERYRDLAWWRLSPADTTEIRRLLLEKHGTSTTKSTLATLRGVLAQCFRLGYMNGDDFHRATSWPRVLGSDETPLGRMLTYAEVTRIRAAYAAETPFPGALDGALFELGLGAGLRGDELARLAVGALDLETKTLRVLGKRAKVRRIPLPPSVLRALKAWGAQRDRFPFEAASMFLRIQWGRAVDVPLSQRNVWARMHALGEKAGVRFMPHDLRRTYISLSLSAGDVITASKNAGHSDPRTTAIYDKRPFNARIRTALAVGELLESGWREKDL